MPVEISAPGLRARARGPNASAVTIIQRIARGESEALAELFELHSGLVSAVATRILRNHEDAQDVVQTVFVQVWRQADRYDSTRGSPGSWLSAIARTRALDCLRRRRSRREEASELVPEAATRPPIVERLTARQALAGLSVGQRLPLTLAYYEGLTQVEIAQRVGAPLGTIKSRMRAALIQLREALRTRTPAVAGGTVPTGRSTS
jgi:RNA polymerase sigma-70 factor, ECF subfamily